MDMFYRLITSACFMAICTEVAYSATIMKAQNEDLVQSTGSAVEAKQTENKPEHLPSDSDMDSEFDDWLFEYLNASPPSKPGNMITPDKRFGFVGSRGKKRHYGYMGSRGKKRHYGFMASRGKKSHNGYMGSRGKKSNVGDLEVDNIEKLLDGEFMGKSLDTDTISTADEVKDAYDANEKRSPHVGFHGSRG